MGDAARAAEALEYTSSLAQSGLPGIPSELPEVIPPESIYASVGRGLHKVVLKAALRMYTLPSLK